MSLLVNAPTEWQSLQVIPGRGARTNSSFQYIEIRGTTIKYIGPGEEDSQAAACRANRQAPTACGLYYYEVEIVNKGRDCFISIGFSAEDVHLNRLVGWEKNSYGYHGDDGHAFEGSGRGRKFGPEFTTGDVIGALYNQVERTISFFKNGVEIGVAFRDITTERLWPAVGMRTPGEEIRANFGERPFKTDFEGLVRDARRRVMAQIASTALPSGSIIDEGEGASTSAAVSAPTAAAVSNNSPSLQLQLVLRYLIHAGYSETAHVVAKTLCQGAGLAEDQIRQMDTRRDVRLRILEGDLGGAIALVKSVAPTVIDSDSKLRFQLQLLKYMDAVRGNDLDGALLFAQTELVRCVDRKDKVQLEQLQDALALLSCEEPASNPASIALHESIRSQVADCLQDALLQTQGMPVVPELEALYRQASVCHDESRKLGVAAMALVSLDDLVLAKEDGAPLDEGVSEDGEDEKSVD